MVLAGLAAWLILALLLAGCAPATRAELPAPTATDSPAVTPAPSLTRTATISPTVTWTPEPTFTATSTPSPLPTGTFTPEAPASARFAVIGDYGQAGEPAAQVAAMIDSWEVDFIITLGDNNYPIGAAETIDENIGQYYHEYIGSYTGAYGVGAETNRFFPSLGNHDWMARGAQPYLDYFTLPGDERYYSFTWGPVELFAVNSDEHEPDGFRRDSIQAGWLREGLAASQAPWKIVYFHLPPYSSGTHGGTSWLRWPFEEWGASAVLAGHDHTYERLQIGGIPYFVNGVGGGAIYNFEEVVEGSLARFNDDWGAMRVEAFPGAITFQFVTRAGVLIDEFRMEK